jgi:hypothetical protein
MEDQPYSFEPTVNYLGDIDSIVFTISNQPSWTDFNDNTGSLIGTPKNSDVGEYSDIVIQASNNAYNDKLEAFSIVVNNVNDAPLLSSNIPAQSLNVDSSFNFDASSYFTDADINDNLTFSVVNLPSGINISAQGVISGSTSTVGSYSIEVTATDTGDLKAQGNFNLTVSEPTSKSKSSGGTIYGLLIILFLGLRRLKL